MRTVVLSVAGAASVALLILAGPPGRADDRPALQSHKETSHQGKLSTQPRQSAELAYQPPT